MKTITLYELNYLVRQTIELGMPRSYWVETEIAELRENNGHCYIELIEKDPNYNTPVARASAKCWRQTWGTLKPYFEKVTGQRLSAGMKVLIEVYAQFHEAYGFSWIITNIDPTLTLGDMARRRKEIIRKLKEEGVFDLNKQLDLPLFAQRIAVVSSKTAAGYGDFANQIVHNKYGYRFDLTLFPAIMQGEGIEKSIVKALNAINERYEEFDCVVIIRGGGATSDMSGFDTLELAENVANFPLPVITGIGHDRDECILDMVSHTRVKTPTAAATLLVDNLHGADIRINEASSRLTTMAIRKIDSEMQRTSKLAERIPTLLAMRKQRELSRLDIIRERIEKHSLIAIMNEEKRVSQLENNISTTAEHFLTTQRHRLELLEKRVALLDPQTILRRGYSITTLNGKALRDPSAAKAGDKIVTRLEKGKITSTIN